MRSHQFRVDLMWTPVRRFIPDKPFSVATRRDEIRLSVPVHIGDQDIRRAFLLRGDDVFLPWLAGIRWLFPPGEPVSVGLGFGTGGQIQPPVSIHVAYAQIVAQTGCVAI